MIDKVWSRWVKSLTENVINPVCSTPLYCIIQDYESYNCQILFIALKISFDECEFDEMNIIQDTVYNWQLS